LRSEVELGVGEALAVIENGLRIRTDWSEEKRVMGLIELKTWRYRRNNHNGRFSDE